MLLTVANALFVLRISEKAAFIFDPYWGTDKDRFDRSVLFGVVGVLFDCRDAFKHTEVRHAIPRLDLFPWKYDKLIFLHHISELLVKLLTLKGHFSPKLTAKAFLQLIP